MDPLKTEIVIVGAGPVGRETARLLAEDGHSVILTSRNAGALDIPNVRTISSDAADAAQLVANECSMLFADGVG